jgi:hypothetical protein
VRTFAPARRAVEERIDYGGPGSRRSTSSTSSRADEARPRSDRAGFEVSSAC